MNYLTINQFYLFISLIFFFVLNYKYINIRCFSNLINYYFIELEYNQTHCLNKVQSFDSKNFKNYEYCVKCLKKKKSSKRKKRNSKQILKGIKIYSLEETLDEIINNNKSISRFGDGEFRLIFGISITFQKKNKLLSKRLKNVLQSNEDGLLIGLPNSLNFEYLDKFKKRAKNFWSNFIEKNKFKLMKLLNKDKIYYSSFITRFYFDYKDISNVSKYIKKLKKIWEKKDILIIEGEQSRLGIGNDLFNNTKSITRIICPSINAFKVYNKIFKEILKINKNKLILLALGPTATILAYDLYKAGYRVIDIGHVDIEYEWYLRNTTTKIKIEGKFVNEVNDGRTNIMDINDKNYLNQIIAKVLK